MSNFRGPELKSLAPQRPAPLPRGQGRGWGWLPGIILDLAGTNSPGWQLAESSFNDGTTQRHAISLYGQPVRTRSNPVVRQEQSPERRSRTRERGELVAHSR
jgi:hypothetical protein